MGDRGVIRNLFGVKLSVALCGTFQQRRSRLLAPRLGDGVRLRGVVWLSRSPLHPVCRFAQDDTVGEAERST